MTTGKRIQKARKEKGLTQKELGDKLGVSASMVAQYENDLRNPKIETAEKIAHVLDVTSDFLLGRVDDPHTRWATQDNYDKFDAPTHMREAAEMMDWNPYSYEFCHGCPYYRASGEYVYQLERDPKERLCRYAPQCRRAVKISIGGQQTKMEGF